MDFEETTVETQLGCDKSLGFRVEWVRIGAQLPRHEVVLDHSGNFNWLS